VELITDLDISVDRFLTTTAVVFAANMGAGTGGTLAASANNALAAADALNGGAFDDTDDLLLDITGATGATATSNSII
jgi:hypothetical protein